MIVEQEVLPTDKGIAPTLEKPLTDRILEEDFKHSTYRHNIAYVFVSILTVLLVYSFCNFISVYDNFEASKNSDSVKIAFMSVSAFKSAGLLAALCAFFFKGFPKESSKAPKL